MTDIVPKGRPKQPELLTRNLYAQHKSLNLPKDQQETKLSILLVRGYYGNTFGKVGNDIGVYDDALFLITPDKVYSFNANADPSRYKTNVASVKVPQGILYKRGKHGLSRADGGYPAFRQHSRITVTRWGKNESFTDTEAAPFWINLHKGGDNTTSSLGCFTVPPSQWNEFKELTYSLMDKYDQDILPVVLLAYDADTPPTPDPVPLNKEDVTVITNNNNVPIIPLPDKPNLWKEYTPTVIGCIVIIAVAAAIFIFFGS